MVKTTQVVQPVCSHGLLNLGIEDQSITLNSSTIKISLSRLLMLWQRDVKKKVIHVMASKYLTSLQRNHHMTRSLKNID
jgi:hypothetical protein